MEELLLSVILKAFAILAEAALVHFLRTWFARPGSGWAQTQGGALELGA
ncbi:MAG: hypothetical protein M3Z13_07325 [Candidatus Dormibacteraeota bacterium]|nr:hypothetical protein [Candidatus Dormibacteraeota bacterium]